LHNCFELVVFAYCCVGCLLVKLHTLSCSYVNCAIISIVNKNVYISYRASCAKIGFYI